MHLINFPNIRMEKYSYLIFAIMLLIFVVEIIFVIWAVNNSYLDIWLFLFALLIIPLFLIIFKLLKVF